MAKNIKKNSAHSKRNKRTAGNNIGWKVKVAFLSLIAMSLTIASCKKETNCPDGYNYDIQKNPPLKSAMAEDWCEDERTAVEQGVTDSIQSAQHVRDAIYPALNDPKKINNTYWEIFDGFPSPKDDFVDSVNSHILAIDAFLEPRPDHPNGLNLRALQGFCYVYRDDVVPGMVIKRDALTECEKNVGIDEWKWVNDPCGGYWTSTKTANAAPVWTSNNTLTKTR